MESLTPLPPRHLHDVVSRRDTTQRTTRTIDATTGNDALCDGDARRRRRMMVSGHMSVYPTMYDKGTQRDFWLPCVKPQKAPKFISGGSAKIVSERNWSCRLNRRFLIRRQDGHAEVSPFPSFRRIKNLRFLFHVFSCSMGSVNLH